MGMLNMFLLLTDGITEVVNDRDEEFGLARLERLLTQHAAQPRSRIWELIMGEVGQHGVQQDDQSMLLVRVREQPTLVKPHLVPHIKVMRDNTGSFEVTLVG
jgi:serine/threonine protein phosphatase PrpC